MSLTLYQRLAISLVFAFALVLGLFFWWTQHLQAVSRDEAEQQLHLELAAHLAHDNPLLQQGVYDYQSLENLFHTLMLLGPRFEFYFIDPNGKILTYSAKPGKVKRTYVSLSPINTILNKTRTLPVYGDDPRDPSGQKVFSVAPVTDQNELVGYLYIIIGGEAYDHVFAGIDHNNQLWTTALGICFLLALLAIVLLGLFKSFTSPLMRLAKEMKLVRDANFDLTKVKISHWSQHSHNEIHQLGLSFELMVEQINRQLVELQNVDKQRRELLADLSHDLRTPLASMQGYVETILIKGKELSDEERQKYTEIIFKNASSIRRLIDQIFELAYLEGGQVSVNLETFPIVELLFDVAEKFKLKAEQAGINLTIDSEHVSTLVYTDIAKLERVLSNLIENAIRHTKPGGEINIEVHSSATNNAEVRVIDTGTGISSLDIGRIFDARYRAGNAIDSKAPHAGLGLAITKKLLALLGTEIKVSSELGVGTCFSFYLHANASNN